MTTINNINEKEQNNISGYGKYEIDNQTINLYSDRNGSRMPNYHRMDIGLTLEGKKYKEVKNFETGRLKK